MIQVGWIMDENICSSSCSFELSAISSQIEFAPKKFLIIIDTQTKNYRRIIHGTGILFLPAIELSWYTIPLPRELMVTPSLLNITLLLSYCGHLIIFSSLIYFLSYLNNFSIFDLFPTISSYCSSQKCRLDTPSNLKLTSPPI